MRTIDLLHYYPRFLAEIPELITISRKIEPELNIAYDYVKQMMNEQYIDTMSEYGCSRWEDMLRLTVSSTDTIEYRRFRIKTIINGDLPYTMKNLKRMLSSVVGEDGVYYVDYDIDSFKLNISVGLESKLYIDDVKKLVERVVPANITINVDLAYNTHENLSEYTHDELSNYTHNQLTEEVI